MDSPKYSSVDVTFDSSLQGAQANLQKGLSAFRNTIKSLDTGFKPIIEEVGKTADSITYRLHITTSKLSQLENRIKEMQAKLGVSSGIDPNGIPIRDPSIIGISAARESSLDRRIMQIKNQKDAAALRAKAEVLGYEIQPLAGRDNWYTMNAPSGVAKAFRSYAYKSNSSFNAEQRKAEAAEAQRQKEKRENEWAKNDRKDTEMLRKEKMKSDEKARKEAEKAEQQGSKEKGGVASLARFAKLSLLVFFVRELVKYVKMIFVAVSESANMARKDITSSLATGVGITKIGAYRSYARAKGMSEDVYEDSFSSVNAKFGNITKLDTGALESLALVMGSGIKDLIMTGIGGKDPEELLGKVIDSFSAQALSGRNSVGMTVGVSGAMRELTEYLKKIDPNWAEIFQRKMVDSLSPSLTQNQRDRARNGGLMWDSGVVSNSFGMNDFDKSYLSDIKSSLDSMNQLLAEVKEMFGRWLAPMADGISNMVKSFVLKFGSDEAKQKYYDSNMREAQERLETNSSVMGKTDKRVRDKMKLFKDKYGITMNEEHLFRASEGLVPSSLGMYTAPDRDTAIAFQGDLQDFMLDAALLGKMQSADKKLRKAANPRNSSPDDTSAYSLEAITSSAIRTALSGMSTHYSGTLGVSGRAYESGFQNEYLKRGFLAENSAVSRAKAESTYVHNIAGEYLKQLPEGARKSVVEVKFTNEDNLLTIQLLDSKGEYRGGGSTQIGLPHLARSGSIGIDDITLANAFSTPPASPGTSMKTQQKNAELQKRYGGGFSGGRR